MPALTDQSVVSDLQTDLKVMPAHFDVALCSLVDASAQASRKTAMSIVQATTKSALPVLPADLSPAMIGDLRRTTLRRLDSDFVVPNLARNGTDALAGFVSAISRARWRRPNRSKTGR
jgi:hypothetical protein